MCPVTCGTGLTLLLIGLFGGGTVGFMLCAVLSMSKDNHGG